MEQSFEQASYCDIRLYGKKNRTRGVKILII